MVPAATPETPKAAPVIPTKPEPASTPAKSGRLRPAIVIPFHRPAGIAELEGWRVSRSGLILPKGFEPTRAVGARKIGSKIVTGRQILEQVSCSECRGRAKRRTVTTFGPEAIFQLLGRNRDEQKNIIKLKIHRHYQRRGRESARCGRCAGRAAGGSALR